MLRQPLPIVGDVCDAKHRARTLERHWNRSIMRIISVRVAPGALVLTITYALFGLSAFLLYALSSADFLTLPFGVLMPLFHLNLNFNLARSSGAFYNIFLCAAAVLSYAVTGWITGALTAVCFNVIAKQMGGIDAKYVSVAEGKVPAQSTL
jgi:hypothetical protein